MKCLKTIELFTVTELFLSLLEFVSINTLVQFLTPNIFLSLKTVMLTKANKAVEGSQRYRFLTFLSREKGCEVVYSDCHWFLLSALLFQSPLSPYIVRTERDFKRNEIMKHMERVSPEGFACPCFVDFIISQGAFPRWFYWRLGEDGAALDEKQTTENSSDWEAQDHYIC